MEPVRIGVIGVGTWGRNHARVLASLPEASVIGFHDRDADRAREAAREWGGRPFANAADLLREVEAVILAVPTTLHYPLTLQALKAGVHTLVEKPIASSPAEAEKMAEAARAAGKVLAVGHLERFNPAVEALLQAEPDPRFVEIHRLSLFDIRGLDVSVVLDLMIHDIDILLRLVRSPLETTDAIGVPVLSASVDIANARLRFRNGCVANLTASRISLTKTRKIRIFEKNAYISVNYTDQTAKAYRRAGGLPSPEELTRTSFERLVEREDLPVERGEPLQREIVHFLRGLRGEGGKMVTPSEAAEALQIAHRILEKIGAGYGATR